MHLFNKKKPEAIPEEPVQEEQPAQIVEEEPPKEEKEEEPIVEEGGKDKKAKKIKVLNKGGKK